jgi:hypothetical protein
MTEVMMALGSYRFSVRTAAFDALRRSSAWRWPAQERIGRAPARQFVGAGDDALEISGVIYPHYAGGLRQVERLRETAGSGVPLPLVDGRGRLWGMWCIERIEETGRVFHADGRPQKIEFSLTLAAYGEDA